ncbi:hypothetical protein CIPAW_16G015300 [Carya illinoinensis]|uniref:Uncharacterized protein n=1 Tax=Carya illinoinensis TaxID=32201 RepID=A0A8T1N3M6_CARIL|nr:hypothetical protein CIPAW_16G015300 [Carya illinoinensis]
MLSGKRVKLFLLKFRDSKEDKLLRSSGSAPSNRLESPRSRATNEVNTEKKLGNDNMRGAPIENKSGEGGWPLHLERMRILRAGIQQMTLGKTKSFLHFPRFCV